MARVRGEEMWARRCIGTALGGVEVVQHDDGSEAGMHDLEIIYRDRAPGAVEITAAADAESIELWNLMNGGDRWQAPNLIGGWFVELSPLARGRRVLAELPVLLRLLERAGIDMVHPGQRTETMYDDALASLGITRLSQGGTEYPGSIYPTIHLPSEISGGFVGETGDSLAEWLSAWLQEPTQRGSLGKLARSGAPERHFFVLLPGFSVAPFEAAYLLMTENAPLPTLAPTLPGEVTHVWCMSTWNTGTGMRWSPQTGWQRFDKLLSGEGSDGDPPGATSCSTGGL